MGTTAAAVAQLPARAPSIVRFGPGAGPDYTITMFDDQPRAVIGITTTSGSAARDTLGVFVSAIRSGSPADKAGIEEGDRIASVNGVSLRLTAADIGDDEMAGVMSRRLTRELDKLKPGDNVELRLYANGQAKTVRVKTEAPGTLYRSAFDTRRDSEPTLGLRVGENGSRRDSLGVFVMAVDDGGPAAKAGIQEGSRIASINGVDVRPRRDARDDDELSVVRIADVSRLQREVSRLKPGDVAALRVYYDGQYKNVNVTVGTVGSLPRGAQSLMIMNGNMLAPAVGGLAIDGGAIAARTRRAVEDAMTASRAALERVGGRMAVGTRVQW